MRNVPLNALRLPRFEHVVYAGALALSAACAGDTPVSPDRDSDLTSEISDRRHGKVMRTVNILRRVTARYHDLDAAVADGFVFLHACEIRPEGAVGMLFVHLNRLGDGIARPEAPDALIYEPSENPGEKPALVGVEFAIPYALWEEVEPPRFLDAEFQREDEFGVFGLHVWVWRENPNGLFAEANPRVACSSTEE